MKPVPYWPANKHPDYLALMRFSRQTNAGESDPEKIVEVINLLPTSDLPVRPLLPLIYRNAVKTGCFARLAPETQAFLKQNSMLLVGQELANQQWLKTTIASFGKNGIPIILLKGAAFANNLYSADAPRLGVDIDFLVWGNDFEKACNLLAETMTEVVMAEDRIATHHTLFERMFVPQGRATPTVEIHRGLTNPFIFSIDESVLWSRSVKHPANNSDMVRTLSPEDTLMHLAVHAFRDMDFCTHNLLDAYELFSQRGVSSEELLRIASDWRARTVLFYLLENAYRLMEAPIEKTLLESLQPAGICRGIHEKLLASPSLQQQEKTARYRLTQLASQLTLPDSLTAAMKFQLYYAVTRLKDLASR